MESGKVSTKQVKKGRSKNFTANELRVLVDQIYDHKNVLMGKFENGLTFERKKNTWRRVAESVSAEGVAERTEDEVRKKYKNFS